MSDLPNVNSVVALLMVTDMQRSVAFYVDCLGFVVQERWETGGRLRWCRLKLGGSNLMLQEARDSALQQLTDNGVLGNGISLYFSCHDALAIYRHATMRDLKAKREPQVGNSAWEVFFVDPDGYQINFSSPTHIAEETLLSSANI